MNVFFKHRAIFCLAALLILPKAAPSTVSAADQPNIIFIMADDLGYGDLGCYGQEVIQTPNIDRLAAEGLRFTDHYAGSTVCAPARCTLMTGLHTGHARVRGNDRVPLEPDDVTVADVLQAAGYATGLIGKWGLGEPESTGIPNRQGFDYFFGYLNQKHAHNYYPEYLWRQEVQVRLPGNRIGPEEGVSVERVTYSHDLLAEKALSFVERNQEKPFFLYLALTIPHANNEGSRVTGDGMEVPDYGIYADEDWPNVQKGQAAMITLMDADIGRLLAKLKELELDDDTIVFFTSDNGPHREGGKGYDPDFFESRGPLRGIKRDLYEGGIRVPMIARWPGKIKAGSTSDHVWAFWDVLPTLAELAGAESPKEIDGISAVPSLFGSEAAGREQEEPEFLYWEFHEGRASKQAARMGKWKGVRLAPSAPIELYDLEADLGEQNDIAAQHPEIVSKITTYLDTERTESEHWPLLDRDRDRSSD